VEGCRIDGRPEPTPRELSSRFARPKTILKPRVCN